MGVEKSVRQGTRSARYSGSGEGQNPGEDHFLTVGFCITSHGLGHTTRAIALMQSLQELCPAIHFAIASTASKELFEGSGVRNFSLLNILVDPGLVQSDELNLDIPKTMHALAQAKLTENESKERLKQFFSDSSAVISDIAPLGLEVARELGLLGVLVENFRWDWVYAHFDLSFQVYADSRAKQYSIVDLHIQTAPVCQKVEQATQFGIFARRPFSTREYTRERLGIADEANCILLSRGGAVPREILVEIAEYPEDCIWVVPTNIYQSTERIGSVQFVPANYYHPDLVAAADLVVGKIGYSTIAEVATTGARFAYYSRAWFPETARLVEFVEATFCATALEKSLVQSRGEILSLLSRPRRETVSNEVSAAARLILDRLGVIRDIESQGT